MRNRNIRIQVRLNDIEYSKLISDIEKEKTTLSKHIRKLIIGSKLKEKPDKEFYKVMNELSRIGNNLNQIARVANEENIVNSEEYWKQSKIWNKFMKKVTMEYLDRE